MCLTNKLIRFVAHIHYAINYHYDTQGLVCEYSEIQLTHPNLDRM